MPNLTRDPFHRNTGGYTKNMNKLTITVDGVELDSKRVLNVYLTSLSEKPPRVEMISEDKDGNILTEVNEHGREVPSTYDVIGDDIHVEGKPSHCGCWGSRQVEEWWRYIKPGGRSW